MFSEGGVFETLLRLATGDNKINPGEGGKPGRGSKIQKSGGPEIGIPGPGPEIGPGARNRVRDPGSKKSGFLGW